jgi:hypothetical protein
LVGGDKGAYQRTMVKLVAEGRVVKTGEKRATTYRARRLAPRVSSDDIDRAAGIVADAEAIHATLAGLRAKYRLR